MKIIVCGGRDWRDGGAVDRVLTLLHARKTITLLVHGACPTGADFLADQWAERTGVERRPYPADWKRLGAIAGPLRNDMMAAAGADGCVAFPGGAGTADMVRKAEAKGIKVWKPYGV